MLRSRTHTAPDPYAPAPKGSPIRTSLSEPMGVHMTEQWDVVVVGGGNASLRAAQSARQQGARVLLLEKAPRQWAGGNSYFTAGAMRTSHGGLTDLTSLVEPLPADRAGRVDLAPYTRSEEHTSELQSH